ncbi:MAG: transcriptional regulator GutM [Thermoflexales bacterium]|nr:transcriptional regulator GutM [Thermoflexales bacterium]
MNNGTGDLGWLVVALIVMWLVQFGLSYLQMRRYYGRLSVLRREGPTATGMSGNRLNTRAYGVLTLDRTTRLIKRAEQLSGFTVFASLKPVPALVGLPLDAVTLSQSTPRGISGKQWKAFCAAADFLRKQAETSATAAAPSPTQEVTFSQA